MLFNRYKKENCHLKGISNHALSLIYNVGVYFPARQDLTFITRMLVWEHKISEKSSLKKMINSGERNSGCGFSLYKKLAYNRSR